MQYIRIGSKILFTNRIIFLLWSFTELPQGKVAELALWFMLEMKSVAKSIKYCALEYCAEKSTAKLVQFFFWPIKAREFYVSNFCTVQNLTDLFFLLTKILSLVCLVTLLPTTHPLKMMNMMAIMLRQTFSTTKWTLSPFRFFFLPPALHYCLKVEANFSHLNSRIISRHKMDAHPFTLLFFTILWIGV